MVLDQPNPVTEPLLTVPSALVPLVFLALLLKPATAAPARPWWRAGAVVGGVAAVATLASYDVPLVVVVASLGLVAVGSLVLGLADSGARQTAFGLVALGISGSGVRAGAAQHRRSSPSPPASCSGSR